MEGDKTKGKEDEESKKTKVRITLTCKQVKNLESVTGELIARAKNAPGVTVYGPKRMPVKKLSITCRQTPCGEGSKTWDRFEMKIFKRVIDLICTAADIKQITSIRIDPGVEVEIAMTTSE